MIWRRLQYFCILCYVMSGYCDEDNECICNEEQFSIKETVEKELDGMSIFDYIKDKVQ